MFWIFGQLLDHGVILHLFPRNIIFLCVEYVWTLVDVYANVGLWLYEWNHVPHSEFYDQGLKLIFSNCFHSFFSFFWLLFFSFFLFFKTGYFYFFERKFWRTIVCGVVVNCHQQSLWWHVKNTYIHSLIIWHFHLLHMCLIEFFLQVFYFFPHICIMCLFWMFVYICEGLLTKEKPKQQPHCWLVSYHVLVSSVLLPWTLFFLRFSR